MSATDYSVLYPSIMTRKLTGFASIRDVNGFIVGYGISHDIQTLPREIRISEVKHLTIGYRTLLEIVTESNTYRYGNNSYYRIEVINVDINNNEAITGIWVREFIDEGV
jgi:hypothetical protein